MKKEGRDDLREKSGRLRRTRGGNQFHELDSFKALAEGLKLNLTTVEVAGGVRGCFAEARWVRLLTKVLKREESKKKLAAFSGARLCIRIAELLDYTRRY